MIKNFKPLAFITVSAFVFVMFANLPKVKAEDNKKVTILFTHDMHDHLLPVKDEENGNIISSGGFSRLQSAILLEKREKSEAILIDAGDYSMGTPFQTIYKSYSPELRLMGQLGYDVVTFGNHEYDYRAKGLAESLNAAKSSGDNLPVIVQSNVSFPENTDLKSLKDAYSNYGVKDYTIIDKNGVKIGIFGLMGEDAASNAPMSGVKFTDPIENAKRVINILKKENVDLIVCLSHSGTSSDKSESEDEILAKKVPEINVIISGHTHSKLSEPIKVGNTIIGSLEDSCKYLGVMNISKTSNSEWNIDNYNLKKINNSIINNGIKDDKNISETVNSYKKIVQEEFFDKYKMGFDEVLAVSPFSFLTVNKIYNNHREEPLGNLICDSYIYAVKKAEGDNYIKVDAAIVPVGTIRGTFFKGDITAADVFSTSSLGIGPDNIPGYPLISVYLTGKELKTACEVDASISPMMLDAQLFFSGVSFTFNPNRLIFNKVTDVSLQKKDGTLEKIDDNKLYRVIVGLYSAQMLSIVGDKSYGILSIVPKNKDGVPITDFEAQIVKDSAGGTNNEIKEWYALAEYLKSFNGEIPEYYKDTHSRKIVNNDKNILAIFSSPNKIAGIIYSVIVIIIALIVFVVFKIAKKIKLNKIP